jgi:L-lysine 6-transaminase
VRLRDKADGRTYIDFFQFFASLRSGSTIRRSSTGLPGAHRQRRPEQAVQLGLLQPADGGVRRGDGPLRDPKELPHMFLVEGGAVAIENALKASFDWKVQKNFQRGATKEVGTQVIHFREAFHGRTGYTMSMTNTDPVKTKWYPKFSWPRIVNPKVTFPLDKTHG